MSYVSRSNSTTTLLLASGTFEGSPELNDDMWVAVSCLSDVAGTLYFDFSVDGENWDTFPVGGFDIAAGIHEFHTALKLDRTFRVRYVNGASDQSVFRLKTYFGEFAQPMAPLNQPRGLDADATLTRTTFPWLDISRGLVNGMEVIKKFGRNPAVGTSYVPVTIGGVYPTPQVGSATTLRVKAGGNANDTAAGTGARKITLTGLDENFADVVEEITTAGVSASSPSVNTFTRLHRVHVSESGTYATSVAGSHVGNITIENGAGGTDWANLDVTNFPKSQSEIGAYSVPLGKTAYVFLDDITVDSGKTVEAIFFHRADADQIAPPYSAMRAKSTLTGITGGTTDLSGRQVPLGPFVGPCDIGWMAKVSATTGSVSVEFEIFIVNE